MCINFAKNESSRSTTFLEKYWTITKMRVFTLPFCIAITVVLRYVEETPTSWYGISSTSQEG